MGLYLDTIKALDGVVTQQGAAWADISPEYAARMKLQNRFQTGLDIARYTADLMRADMAAYDADTAVIPSHWDAGMVL